MPKSPASIAINANNLRFYYDRTQAPTVHIAHWQVAQGAQVFLHGESGTGKSTLLQLLSGLRTGEGLLHIAGTPISQLSQAKRDRFRAQNIGMVFQQFNLIPYLSGLDNVRLAAALAGNKSAHYTALAQSLLSDTGLQPATWQQPAHQLSIGQQQRVAIARALINSPPLLLFDEPTSALDETNQTLFMQVLAQHIQHHPKTTTVFVSHDQRLAAHFNYTVALSELSTANSRQSTATPSNNH